MARSTIKSACDPSATPGNASSLDPSIQKRLVSPDTATPNRTNTPIADARGSQRQAATFRRLLSSMRSTVDQGVQRGTTLV